MGRRPVHAAALTPVPARVPDTKEQTVTSERVTARDELGHVIFKGWTWGPLIVWCYRTQSSSWWYGIGRRRKGALFDIAERMQDRARTRPGA